MKLSRHARHRAQKRGINKREMRILIQFGDELSDGAGASIICVNSKRTRKELECLWARRKDFDLASVLGSYMVVRDTTYVVTTGHKRARFQKNRRLH